MRQAYAMVVCLYILLAYNLCARADQTCDSTKPPNIGDIITVPATLKVDPIQEIRVGSLKAEFEKTTLTEIRSAIGTGSIQHSGDGEERQFWLCYSLPSQRVWLISDGEMGGGNHTLTQVHAISIKSTSQGNAACPQEIIARFRSISMNFGWLGTTQKKLLKTLGQPSGRQDGRLMYYYAGKEPDYYDGKLIEWDVTSYIEATIVDNKVSSLYVSHVTTN